MLRIPDFWRWSKAESAKMNNVLNAIASYSIDEIKDKAFRQRHFQHVPGFLLTDFAEDSKVGAVTQTPTCEVLFDTNFYSSFDLMCFGFHWPNGDILGGLPHSHDNQTFITTGTPWNFSYQRLPSSGVPSGDFYNSHGPHTVYGSQSLRFFHGGDQQHTTTHRLTGGSFTKIGLFTLPSSGPSLLVVLGDAR